SSIKADVARWQPQPHLSEASQGISAVTAEALGNRAIAEQDKTVALRIFHRQGLFSRDYTPTCCLIHEHRLHDAIGDLFGIGRACPTRKGLELPGYHDVEFIEIF